MVVSPPLVVDVHDDWSGWRGEATGQDVGSEGPSGLAGGGCVLARDAEGLFVASSSRWSWEGVPELRGERERRRRRSLRTSVRGGAGNSRGFPFSFDEAFRLGEGLFDEALRLTYDRTNSSNR